MADRDGSSAREEDDEASQRSGGSDQPDVDVVPREVDAASAGGRGGGPADAATVGAEGPFVKAGFGIEGGRPANYTVTTEQKHTGDKSIKISAGGADGPDRLIKVSGIHTKVEGGKNVSPPARPERVWG